MDTTQTADQPTTEADLFRMAQEADSEQGIEPSESAQDAATRAAAQAEQTKPSSDETVGQEQQPPSSETEPDERPRDPKTGQFVAKPKEEEPEQPESAYAKAQKEEQRQRNLLQNFETEKQEFREWARMQQKELEQQRQAFEQRFGPARAAKDGFTAPDYRKYASEFAADAQKFAQQGDLKQAFQAAYNGLRSLGTANELEAYEEEQQNYGLLQYYSNAFQQDVQRMAQERPELDLLNPSNPLAPAINQIIDANRELYWMPQGFEKALTIALLQQEAGSASELRERVKQLETDLADRDSMLTPSIGGAAGPSRAGQKSLNDIMNDPNVSDAEKERLLAQQAADLDARGAMAASW